MRSGSNGASRPAGAISPVRPGPSGRCSVPCCLPLLPSCPPSVVSAERRAAHRGRRARPEPSHRRDAEAVLRWPSAPVAQRPPRVTAPQGTPSPPRGCKSRRRRRATAAQFFRSASVWVDDNLMWLKCTEAVRIAAECREMMRTETHFISICRVDFPENQRNVGIGKISCST